MSQSFYGAQPKVVQNKAKYNSPGAGALEGGLEAPINPEEDGGPGLNIMYDKRVFRGNTYNLTLMK